MDDIVEILNNETPNDADASSPVDLVRAAAVVGANAGEAGADRIVIVGMKRTITDTHDAEAVPKDRAQKRKKEEQAQYVVYGLTRTLIFEGGYSCECLGVFTNLGAAVRQYIKEQLGNAYGPSKLCSAKLANYCSLHSIECDEKFDCDYHDFEREEDFVHAIEFKEQLLMDYYTADVVPQITGCNILTLYYLHMISARNF
jgi:hypothetical protein